MPSVLTEAGFRVMIFVNDHLPMHVHVFKGGGQVVINLGGERAAPRVRENRRMDRRDERRALQIVGANQEFLIAEWRRING
jgi:hypothetical protein